MHTDKMMLAVAEDGEPVCECTVDNFVENNDDTLSDVERADLAHMNVGDELKFGFGFTVTRFS